MPDEKRNVGDSLASGINPDATGFHSFGFVASGMKPDALDETVADKPRRYGLKSKRRG